MLSFRRKHFRRKRPGVLLLAVFLIAAWAGCASPEEDAPRQTAATPAPVRNVPTLAEAPPKPDSVAVPAGMVYIPGGATLIGNDSEASGHTFRHNSSARPTFVADVDPFFMDEHPVTVAQFRAFVEAESYVTQAEHFGNAGVLAQGRWRLVEGAAWHHPFGPDGPEVPDDHPVTQVSWNDAVAYCTWAGGRLPTEVEWEHAARGARNSRQLYAWGDERIVGGEHQANTWQGPFPASNTVEDDYRYTSPVGAFGETALGLTDMGGNVWQWTSSWYRPYDERGEPFTPTPQSKKVQRGGSFQCNECMGFRVYTRSHSTPETSLFHVGFRCARDLPSN